MEKDKAIKIGLLVIIIGGVMFWGYNFCKGKNIFSSENLYYTTYDQVEGLQKNAEVLLRGYKIGHVKNIYFSNPQYNQLTVELSINSDIHLPKETIARIFSSDILGSKAIDIILPKYFSEEGEFVSNFDTLNSEIQTSITDQVRIEVAPLKAQAEKLLESAAVAIDQVKFIVNEKNGEELRRCFVKLQNAIDAIHHSGMTLDTILSTNDDNIEGILTNINGITKNFNEHSEEISSIINNVSNMSDSLAQANLAETLKKTEKSISELDAMLQQVNSGNSSLGALINDPSLYKNLDNASQQLNSLLIDIQKHPKRYVSFPIFGSSKDKEQKKEEKQEAKKKNEN